MSPMASDRAQWRLTRSGSKKLVFEHHQCVEYIVHYSDRIRYTLNKSYKLDILIKSDLSPFVLSERESYF